MNIIIPMAGMGKRMRPHTLTTPKPLIPIAGKPIVQRIVEDIIATCSEKIEHIAFVIGPNFGKEVEAHLLAVANTLGATGHICVQEEPKGTAHAILCAEKILDGNTFIAFADTLFNATFSIDTQKDAIIWTQKIEDPSNFGVVKLSDGNKIEAFVEKPQEFVSDLAIIGVYYFKDGANLKKELQRLIDQNIQQKGEYQITDAMEHMLQNGLNFYTDQVSEWLDCGNKDATVYTNQRILSIKYQNESSIDPSATIKNTTIIHPCYIGANVHIENSVIGPHVSLEKGSSAKQSIISNSIIQEKASIDSANLNNSLIGKECKLKGKTESFSIGDYSTQES